tara:strand:- start:1803 stop:2987 length:1185 start_codon:yes stop_codon:yes gene_type:complete
LKNINFKNSYYIFIILASVILFGGLWKYYPIYGSYLFQDWTYIYDYRICLNYPDKADDSIRGLCPVILEYNFVYPDIWIKLGEIGNRTLFKYLILIFVIFYLSCCLNILKKYALFTKFFFILSPVSILLVQRGNNDLIIFCLIYLFYITLENYKNIYYSLLPYILGIILKIYPIVLIPIFYFKKIKINNSKLFVIILALITLISLYLSNFWEAQENYNRAGITLAFNSAVLFKIWNYLDIVEIPHQIISIIILILLFLISIHNKFYLPYVEKKYETSFLIGSAIIVSNFFLNEGFVYKLVFLVFIIPLVFEYQNKIHKRVFIYFIGILFLSLWAEFITFLIEIIFDTNVSKLKTTGLNLSNYIYAFGIVFKNIIYWLLNINLIFISTNLIFRKN